MNKQWSKGRGVAASVLAGALLGGGLTVLAAAPSAANVVLPPDPSWVTNVSQGNNRDDGFKVKAMAKMASINTVYIGGSFTQIAPDNKAFSPSGGPGVAANDSGIDQPYLFAVEATNGAAWPSFQPKLNGPVEAIEVNPATNTVYVGGTFTSVNGIPLNGFAILDATTGALKPGVTQRSLSKDGGPGTAWGLKLVGTKLYVGGSFSAIPGCGAADCNRGELALFDVSTGATTLDPFRAFLQGGKVQALAVDPTNPTFVYVGGQFTGARAVSGGPILPGSSFLVAYNRTTGALVTTWVPGPESPPPGPGGTTRPPEVRDLEAHNSLVYAAIGGGGGRFYVFGGATTNGPTRRLINTDGDVQTLAITPAGDRVFAGGHFTRLNTPNDTIPVPPNDRCQMFSVNTVSTGPTNQQFAIQAQPNMSNGGHYGPFALLADDVGNTWWGGQLTVLQPGWISPEDDDPLTPPLFGPASCGTGDQKNKIGQTSGNPSYVGGIAHLRQTAAFADTVAPATAPGNVGVGRWIFDGVTVAWSPATDDRGITAYYVRATGPGLAESDMVVGTQWGNRTSLNISPAKLQPNANYTFRVCAIDYGDNERCSAPVAGSTGSGPPSLPNPLRGFGQFNPVVPDRILDTRNGVGGVLGPVRANTEIGVTVTGGAANIPSHAGAVVLNVTVVGPSASGYLTTYPNGTAIPNASNLNFNAGQVVPNLVVARVGTNGRVNFQISAGASHVLMDIVGWYGGSGTTAAGSRIDPITPTRKLDSRNGLGMPGGAARPIGPGETIEVNVGSGLTGAVLNITGVGPTQATFVTAFPGDVGSPPNVSNLNLLPGEVRPNLAMVKVANGRIKLYNASGFTHLLVDVVAEYRASTTGQSSAGRILPLDAPMRVTDTRLVDGTLFGPNARLHDYSVIEDATSPNVAGLVLNATALAASAPTFLTLYPGGAPLPDTSNLNVLPGAVIPNLAVARLNGTDDLNVWNQSGGINYILDVTALVLG